MGDWKPKCGVQVDGPIRAGMHQQPHVCIKAVTHTTVEMQGPYHFCKCGHMWRDDNAH